MLLSLRRNRQTSGVPALAIACFITGLAAGALLAPAGIGAVAPAGPPVDAPLRGAHAAEVVRVIDGDTFEARVNIWPGMQVTTRVRLRNIDAPEMSAQCAAEMTKAIAARDALSRLLREGSVGISNIGQDKYGGRVDADVSTARTTDVSAVLIERGVVRRYAGKRESWCG